MLSSLGDLLSCAGYDVDTAKDGSTALTIAAKHPPSAVVTDVRMPGMDGLALLRRLHERDRRLPIVVMTALDDVRSAVAAMRAGAEDYLLKPVDVPALERVLDRALERRHVVADAVDEAGSDDLLGLIGASPAMQRVYRAARQVAASRATTLLTGETGTGKGALARAIHALSPRAKQPFVELHCASLVDSLVESELFGHERGAFTGADRRRVGRFEQANGGTLFLDEIGELSTLMQVKLLRVLQEHTFERVGSNEPIHVDVRVIAATNRDLADDVKTRRFREDLYYRVKVIHIEMPPLRLRGAADVVTLAAHFVRRFAVENQKHVAGLTARARAKLSAHSWPGNVRALENTIERAVVLCQDSVIDEDDLPIEAGHPLDPVRIPGSTMADLERHAILRTLAACDGSTSRAAKILGISRRKVQYRLHEYGRGMVSP